MKLNQRNKHSQRFSFDSSEVKQFSQCSQRFPFNSSEVKQLIECSHRRKTTEVEYSDNSF